MFEVGKAYTFRFSAGIDEHGADYISGVVESYEHPLLKIKDVDLSDNPFINNGRPPEKGGRQRSMILRQPIINVTSSAFVSAVIDGRSED